MIIYLQLMPKGSDDINTEFGTSRDLDGINANKLHYLQ